jgi:hypothetical protein
LPTSPEEYHPLYPAAAAATILDDVVAFGVRGTLLNMHYLFADNAAEKIDQRAFIVIQVTRVAKCFCHFSPSARSQPIDGVAIVVTQGDEIFCYHFSKGIRSGGTNI